MAYNVLDGLFFKRLFLKLCVDILCDHEIILLEKTHWQIYEKIYTKLLITALFITAKNWTQPKCPSVGYCLKKIILFHVRWEMCMHIVLYLAKNVGGASYTQNQRSCQRLLRLCPKNPGANLKRLLLTKDRQMWASIRIIVLMD